VKRFRFALAPLLRLEQQRERLAEAQVALARQAVEQCRARLDQLHLDLKDVADRLARSVGAALPVATWVGLFDQSGRLERAIREADAALRQAEDGLRQAVEARVRLSAEVETLLALRERGLELHREEIRRAEQVRLDEAVLRKWSEGRDGGAR
jgi:flagellar export protein FliJ